MSKLSKHLKSIVTLPQEDLTIHTTYGFKLRADEKTPFKKLEDVDITDVDVLALDASYRYTGFGIRKGDVVYLGVLSPFDHKTIKKRNGTLETQAIADSSGVFEASLWYFYAIQELLEKVKPEKIIVEDITKQLGDPEKVPSARAGILMGCLNYGKAPLAKIPPTSLKKYATGFGAAGKSDMIETVERLYGVNLRTQPLSDDQADAMLLSSVAHHHAMYAGVKFKDKW